MSESSEPFSERGQEWVHGKGVSSGPQGLEEHQHGNKIHDF